MSERKKKTKREQLDEFIRKLNDEMPNDFEYDEPKREIIRRCCKALGIKPPNWGPA